MIIFGKLSWYIMYFYVFVLKYWFVVVKDVLKIIKLDFIFVGEGGGIKIWGNVFEIFRKVMFCFGLGGFGE